MTFDKFPRSSRILSIAHIYLLIVPMFVPYSAIVEFTMRMLRFLDSKIQQCELCFTHMHWSSMFGRVDLKFLYFATATVYGLCYNTIASLLCVSHLDLVYLIPRSTCSICNSMIQRVCTVLVLLGNLMPILFVTHLLLLGSNPILSGLLFATV